MQRTVVKYIFGFRGVIMKNYLNRVTSVILVAATVLCSSLCLDFSAAAAEDTNSKVAALKNTESQSAKLAENPAVTVTSVSYQVNETVPTAKYMSPNVYTEQPTTVPAVSIPAPIVGDVKNIIKTSFEKDKITLTWDKVEGATGYVLYYCNADKTKEFTKVKELTTNSCTIKNLLHTTSYYFKVSAYVVQDGIKYEGKGTVKKTATQPGNMSNCRLSRSSDVIQISWNRNSKATGYKIYRSCAKSKNKYVEYKTIKNNKTTTFIDKKVEKGKTYNYKVKAYRNLYSKNTYNGSSTIIKATCGLCAPNFSMTTQLSRVSLTWKKNKYASGYEVYYSTSKNGKYTKLVNTKNDFYNTKKLSNNKTYYFRVRPYRYEGKNKTKICGTYHTKSIKVTNKAYGKNIGKTYIEVSIKQQHMWFYLNGKLYCETNVVTGNDDKYHATPKGAYKIFQRQSPTTLYGPGYITKVSYWLGFTSSGCGIHDSSWRSSKEYGGTTYKGNGSHGCVNTPYNAIKKIYKKAKKGNYVVVY